MLNSYKRYKGTDTTMSENGSPEGVMIAANTRITHTACFLNDLIVALVIIPIADNVNASIGNSNTIPNVRTIAVNIEIYDDKEKVFGISGLI